LANALGLPIGGLTGLGGGVAAALATAVTGAGAMVLANSPALVTPNLGTPSAANLANATGLPVAGIAGLGAGVAAALALAPTGAGAIVLATNAALTTPNLGTPSALNLTNAVAVTQAPNNNSTKPATTAYADAAVASAVALYPWRNRIINGDMRIDQRHAGAGVGTPAGTITYVIDRWGLSYSQVNKISASRSASFPPNTGFISAFYIVTATAYAVAAADYFISFQTIEGQNIADLMWGSANARAATLSFWAYGSLAGTYGGSLRNGAGNRSFTFSYTLASNTWTYVTVPIPGDTAGTWATDNTAGLVLAFSLGAGANFVTAAGAWTAGNYFCPPGSVNMVATLNANLYVTGVQFEAAQVASAFERRAWGVELALCQRYYAKSYDTATAPGASTEAGATEFVAQTTTAFQMFPTIRFPATMRAAPSLVAYSTTGASNAYRDIDAGADIAGAGTTTGLGQGSGHIQLTGSAAVAGHRYGVHWTAEAEL
jgi:hypothetical protein